MAQERMDSAGEDSNAKRKVSTPETSASSPKANSQGGEKVRVVHGVNQGYYNLEGKTVAKTRKALTDVYNIPRGAKALIDGQEVADEFVLMAGQNLEFLKDAGDKG